MAGGCDSDPGKWQALRQDGLSTSTRSHLYCSRSVGEGREDDMLRRKGGLKKGMLPTPAD